MSFKKMDTIKVIPIYGYGWMKGEASIEVPEPFEIQVSRTDLSEDTTVYAMVAGQVSTNGHEFNRLWVLLALRSSLPNPTYNVFLYEKKPPFAVEGQIDPYAEPRLVTGFANVSAPNVG
jgi:hypothetical protein